MLRKRICALLCAAAVLFVGLGGNAYAAGTEEADFVAWADTVDIGWAQYLTIRLAEGSADDYTFAVDGKNVEVSPVDDDGTIVKWELTSLDHRELCVTRNSDGEEEKVILNEKAGGSDRVRTAASAAPDYFLAHGSVFVWDYQLTNYDDAGNVRVNPAKTTFDLSGKDSGVPYYAPDAELVADDSNTYGVGGEAVVMFNYSTAEEKAWFDGISDVDLVKYGENRSTLNGNLKYTLETDVPHGNSTVAQVTVPLGQSNFYSNGRYYLRITSNGTSSLFPIHVVNEKAPSMRLSEVGLIKSGQNIHFKVSDMNYGVEMPVYRVVLETPAKETVTLEKFEDWYLIGDTFVIYNDKNNNIEESGIYTVTVYADGFKAMAKSFFVSGASTSSFAAVKGNAYRVDTVSSASTSGGGGATENGSDGGSTTMNTDLLFDADLLANALLLDTFGIENVYAEAISERWLTEMSGWDAAFKEGENTFYTFVGFRDAVEDAKINGQYLTFEEYISEKEPEITLNRPYGIKAVLEDNLLGQTQTGIGGIETTGGNENIAETNSTDGDPSQEKESVSSKAPARQRLAPPTEIADARAYMGYDFKLTFADTDWLASISGVTVNGTVYTKVDSSLGVWNDTDYFVDPSSYILIGEGAAEEGKENKIVISADGYWDLELKVTKTVTKDVIAEIVSHVHQGGTANCQQQAICEICQEPYGELGEHIYENGVCTVCGEVHTEHTGGTATCTEQAVCEICGGHYGELVAHVYENGICTVCGEAHTEHTGGTATCTEQAVCEICGGHYGELEPHAYEKGVCTVCGQGHTGHSYEEGICTVCGAADPQELEKVKNELQGTKDSLEAVQGELSQIQQELQDVREALQTAQKELTEAQEGLKTAQENYDNAQAALAEARTEADNQKKAAEAAEAARKLEEAKKEAAEAAQKESEVAKEAAELAQRTAELEREEALTAQKETEAAKEAAELAQKAAELEKEQALAAQKAAEQEKEQALAAQKAAEAAQKAAEQEKKQALEAQEQAKAEAAAARAEADALKKQQTSQQVQINETFILNGYAYKVLDTESKTAALTGLENKNGKKAVVPAAVEYKGVSFQVTAIADKAFYGCKKLTSVTVGENVSSIGKQSFAGCGKLKAVYLKSGNITAIGKKAFAKINGKAKVYVPKKKAAAYKKLLKKAGLKAGAKIVKKAY